MATVKALVVGGGGGGGTNNGEGASGGGGAGGYQYNAAFTVITQTYAITVGNGGSVGSNGGNSVFDSITAYGGGSGGYSNGSLNGANGGSGGGAASNYVGNNPQGGTGSQGYNGGNSYGFTDNPRNTGGGGGSASAGIGSSTRPDGGSGTSNSISGSAVVYAAGGGGGQPAAIRTNYGYGLGGSSGVGGRGASNSGGANAVAGTVNTGSGGGGSGNIGGAAAGGGSGIVIIRYVTADFGTCSVTGAGNAITTDGLDSIATFITSGDFIVPVFKPTVITTSATAATTSIDAVGNVTSDGGGAITERGFCYNITGTPTISNSKAVVSGTTGSYSTNISPLPGELTYYVRAYATNSAGTSYGAEIDVFVKGLPEITQSAVTNIDIVSATGNGNVTADNGAVITSRGFCWNTSTNPTTANSKVVVSGTTGSYSGVLSPLAADTLYYVRSYATNSYGTVYGSEVTFTSLALGAKQLVKNIGAIEGETYAVQIKTNITSGTVTLKLGTTGDSVVISGTGAVTTVLQGEYGGLSGIIVESSDGFVGTVDDVFWVLVLGTATIDWSAATLTNLIPVNSSVKFRRVEDKEITRFNLYRYIDTLFKDLDGYITITVTEESNDLSSDRSKVFIVGNTTGTPSPFVKKKISILSKNQAIILQYANNKLNETFTICSFSLTGFKEVRKLYKPDAIISI